MSRLRNPGEQYLYSALPTPDSIRLLLLQPASSFIPEIRCNVATCCYKSGGYAALSYTWAMNSSGDASFTSTIYLDDVAYRVTQNLYEGLLRIRDLESVIVIWVDAVCINQADLHERTQQVSQMADIYTHADEVVVWLGEGSDTAEDVAFFDFLQRFHTHRGAKHSNNSSDGLFVSDRYHMCFLQTLTNSKIYCCSPGEELVECPCTTLEPDGRGLRSAAMIRWTRTLVESNPRLMSFSKWMLRVIESFFSRRYWKRLWIVQELFHAKKINCYWGSCRWEITPAACYWVDVLWGGLTDFERAIKECDKGDLGTVKPFTHTSNAIGDFRDFLETWTRKTNGRLTRENLAFISATYTDFQCADPRDRVYALVSMGEPQVLPDYSLTVEEVYTTFAKKLIEHGDWRWVLWNMQRGVGQKRIRGSKGRPSLPSWVPDMREEIRKPVERDYSLPMSVKVCEDSSLLCQVRCLGVLHVNREAQDQTSMLTIVPDEALHESLFSKELLHGSVSPGEDGLCSILFHFSAVGSTPPNIEWIATGDIMFSTNKDVSKHEELLVLRPLDDLVNTYVFISRLNSRYNTIRADSAEIDLRQIPECPIKTIRIV